ncbi:ttc4 [Symbiodinium necroappetens]|uniref:Ttc4 protein n=1 Tax=Symbiodinium necroappetens TaxID=1628268 RepID=A0A812V9M3_9DINO|nr:ttc4 [Symbiodinium necroappetens]
MRRPCSADGSPEDRLQWRGGGEGLEVRCSDPKLNAQLYSNRAHVRLLLRQFVEAVDDCRRAIEQDPKNIKAYWRAARASLHLDLCRNGIDFCEAGLKQAPGDSDLMKLRDSCAEKLAGQQQRRAEARTMANRDFNADEAMAVQEKVSGLSEQLARLQASFASKQRQRVRLELTQQTVTSTPEDTKLYRGVGRCFLLGDRQPILDEMKQTMDSIDEDLGKNIPKPEACEVQSLEDSGWEELPKMQKASQELEKRKDDAEKACGGDMSMPLKYPTFEGAARDDCRVPEAGRAKLRFLSVEQLAPCWLTHFSSTQILGGRTFCRYSRMTDAGKERIEPRAEGTRVMQRGRLDAVRVLPLSFLSSAAATSDKDGMLEKAELKKYAQAELKCTLTAASVDGMFRLLTAEGAKGVRTEDFQRAKVQVGILREKKIDLERKKRREEREKELEKLKDKLKGRIEVG